MRGTPVGVLILGFLEFAQGVTTAFWGFIFIGLRVFDFVPSGTGVVWIGVLAILSGLVQIAVGIAAWRLRPWAWLFAWIMSTVGLITAFFALLATGSLAYGLAAAIFPLIVYWYLNTPEIKKAFAIPNQV